MSVKTVMLATFVLAFLALGFAVLPVLRAADAAGGQAPTQAGERVFEMRTYHASPGKLDALHKRFRDHTLRLFEKHGITSIAYWTPIEGQKGHGEVLVFVLAYPDAATKEKAWNAFAADPEWQAAKKASEADGTPLAAKAESVLMKGSDYSPMK